MFTVCRCWSYFHQVKSPALFRWVNTAKFWLFIKHSTEIWTYQSSRWRNCTLIAGFVFRSSAVKLIGRKNREKVVKRRIERRYTEPRSVALPLSYITKEVYGIEPYILLICNELLDHLASLPKNYWWLHFPQSNKGTQESNPVFT